MVGLSNEEKPMSEPQVKTEEKKQHFDDIYVAETPVPFKERIIDALDYISDDFNRQTFDRLILPWAQQQADAGKTLNYVDLCCCFGNTTMAAVHGMDVEAIRANWADEQACKTVAAPRRLPIRTTGIDISGNALAYGKSAGLFDQTFEADLNQADAETRNAIEQSMEEADIVISTASLVYLDPPAIESLVDAFARGKGEGYMLVNFLNPFALEKADATKRLLLNRLDFVGSTATRHRRLSPLEQENYPGEDWALLEIWVLRRRG
jgi:hypothetical protein